MATTAPTSREAMLASIKKSRSPLRKGLDLEQTDDDTLQQIHGFLALSEPQHRYVKKTVTWLFMLAGFLWMPLFFPSITSLSVEQLVTFKANQLRLYVILLSLWGYIKHRRMKQMVAILHLSTQRGVNWFALTRDDLREGGVLSVCEGFTKLEGSDKSYFHLVLVWLFTLLGIGQLGRQCWLLFGS